MGEPFARVILDCVGLLPRTRSGHVYLLTLMCVTARYPEAVPLHTVRGPLKMLRENWLAEQQSDCNLLEYVSSFRERLHNACKLAQAALESTQVKMKKRFDKNAVSRSFSEGDKVLVLYYQSRVLHYKLDSLGCMSLIRS